MLKILLISVSLLFSYSYANENLKKGEFLGAKHIEAFPSWFKTSFLDFSDDISEAKDANRHVLIYFHQDGCPYCAKTVEENFANEKIVSKLKPNFDVIEINMWGDRSLTDWNGKEFIEKEFAAHMRVQFTPTIIFLNGQGETVLRLNGYHSIDRMVDILDFVYKKQYIQESFASFIAKKTPIKQGNLNQNSLFEAGPHFLSRSARLPAEKYLAVFFEEPNCPECDQFHKEIINTKASRDYLSRMQVVQLNALSEEKLITPQGKRTTAKDWYSDLDLTYKPAIVFFDKDGQEIVRRDAFFKEFHTHGMMTYVLSNAFKAQPSFQRYLEDKADKLREQGITVDLWK